MRKICGILALCLCLMLCVGAAGAGGIQNITKTYTDYEAVHFPAFTITVPEKFEDLVYGYTSAASTAPIQLMNGSEGALHGWFYLGSATDADNDQFTITATDEYGNAVNEVSVADNSGRALPFTITPKADLIPGTYNFKLNVYYGSEVTSHLSGITPGTLRDTITIPLTVKKQPQAAPGAPEIVFEATTASTITIKTIADNANGARAEYSINGGSSWVVPDLNSSLPATLTLTGLTPETNYKVIARYRPTEFYETSAPGPESAEVRTLKRLFRIVPADSYTDDNIPAELKRAGLTTVEAITNKLLDELSAFGALESTHFFDGVLKYSDDNGATWHTATADITTTDPVEVHVPLSDLNWGTPDVARLKAAHMISANNIESISTVTIQDGYVIFVTQGNSPILLGLGKLPSILYPATYSHIIINKMVGEPVTELKVNTADANIFQWYYKSNPEAFATPVAGATGAQLSIPSAKLTDTGLYYCKVGNSYTTPETMLISGLFDLRVTTTKPVSIKSPTEKTTIYVHDDDEIATLSIEAEGADTYLWESYRDDLHMWLGMVTPSQPSLDTLYYPGHSNRYRCVAQNASSEATSPEFEVKLVKPVKILEPQGDKIVRVREGDEETLRVVAENADHYRWEYSPDGHSWTLLPSTEPTLTVKGEPGKAGLYKCIASNEAGSSAEATFTVIHYNDGIGSGTPMLEIIYPTDIPTIIEANEGGEAHLRVEAKHVTNYRWDMRYSSTDNWFTLEDGVNSALTFTDLSVQVSGMEVRCVVSNDVSAAPVYFKIIVHPTPVADPPKTGDSANLALWAALCVLSLAGATLCGKQLIRRRR